MHLVIRALVLGLTLVALAACGDRGDTNPTAATGPVYCKSPITGESVPKAVALSQARREGRRRQLALGDTQSITVNVDCGDTTEVVFVPVEPVPDTE